MKPSQNLVKAKLKRRRLGQVKQKQSIVAMKSRVMKRSASAQSGHVADPRKSYGFFPADADVKVVRWPEL